MDENGHVFVRLRDFPREKRLKVAKRYIRENKLEGFSEMELLLAAHRPSENPGMWVTLERLAEVLR
jgi:hypothetical protein